MGVFRFELLLRKESLFLLLRSTHSRQFEKLHFIPDESLHTYFRAIFSDPLCLCIPLDCENGKTTAVKFIPEKIMKIINFSVTTVANWMVNFYYMETRCYKLKLFIFNASDKKHFHSVRNPLLSCSILYGLRMNLAFIMLIFYLRFSRDENGFSSCRIGKLFLCDFARFVSNFSQANAIISRMLLVAKVINYSDTTLTDDAVC